MERRGLIFSWLFPVPVSDLQDLIAIPKVSSRGQYFGHVAVKVNWSDVYKNNKCLTLLIWAVRVVTDRCKDVIKPMVSSESLSRFSASTSLSNFSI